jgi:hypothetical protein
MTPTDTTAHLSDPFAVPSDGKGTDPEVGGGNAAYSFDGKPDRWKRYRLPHPVTGAADGWTRATTFAKSISDTFKMSQWGTRMGGYGLLLRPDLQAALAAAWPDRDRCNDIMEEAKGAAGSKVGANLGTAIHAFTEAIDRGETPMIPAAYQTHVAAWSTLLAQYNLRVLDIERVVLCLRYGGTNADGSDRGVAGTLDRVCEFTKDTTVTVGKGRSKKTLTFAKGERIIVDLKTGRDLEYGWLEIAVQLSVYANAEQCWSKDEGLWLPQWERMRTDFAMVVHLPAQEPGATMKAAMHLVNIKGGDEIAQLCTAVRAARKRKDLAVELSVVEEVAVSAVAGEQSAPTPRAAVTTPQEPSWEERVKTASTVAQLNEIWLAALGQRQDTPALVEQIRFRRRAIEADTAGG